MAEARGRRAELEAKKAKLAELKKAKAERNSRTPYSTVRRCNHLQVVYSPVS